MGPSFAVAESTHHRAGFAALLATLCASLIAIAALPAHPHPGRHSYDQYRHFKPVKACVDGRWVYARNKTAE